MLNDYGNITQKGDKEKCKQSRIIRWFGGGGGVIENALTLLAKIATLQYILNLGENENETKGLNVTSYTWNMFIMQQSCWHLPCGNAAS